MENKYQEKCTHNIALYAIIHMVEMTNDKNCVDDNNDAINWKDEANESTVHGMKRNIYI